MPFLSLRPMHQLEPPAPDSLITAFAQAYARARGRTLTDDRMALVDERVTLGSKAQRRPYALLCLQFNLTILKWSELELGQATQRLNALADLRDSKEPKRDSRRWIGLGGVS